MSNPNKANSTPNSMGPGKASQSLAATTQQTTQDVKEQVQQTTQSLQTQARNAANAQLSQTSHGLTQFAQSVREFSQDLRGQNQGMMGELTGRTADQLEQVATYMQRDVGQMAEDLNTYATRQPVVFLAGAFVLGIIGARFLKSSNNQGHSPVPPPSHGAATSDFYGSLRRDATAEYSPTSGNGVL